MMLERRALIWRKWCVGTMEMPHQIAFAISQNAVAQDEIVHPPTNIDRVDLNVTVMGQRSVDVCHWLIEQ